VDIRNVKVLYLKGGLFVVAGLLASGLILLECPSWKVAGLLALAVWCFARAYYFAFYVVEKYADPGFRFAGLASFLRYVAARRSGDGDVGVPRRVDHPPQDQQRDQPAREHGGGDDEQARARHR